MDAVWELAGVACPNAQLHDDDVAERVGLPPAERRATQVRLLIDSYGLAQADLAGPERVWMLGHRQLLNRALA